MTNKQSLIHRAPHNGVGPSATHCDSRFDDCQQKPGLPDLGGVAILSEN